MSTATARTTVEAMHMRLVYFVPRPSTTQLALSFEAEGAPVDPITARDLTRVFRQLDLLIDYARLITPPTEPSQSGRIESHGAASTEQLRSSWQQLRAALSIQAAELGKHPGEIADFPPMADPSEEVRRVVSEELGLGPGDLVSEISSLSKWMQSRLANDEGVSVTALRMGSPLEVLAEIPLVAWPVVGVGLIALAERIATMPVRITRKRKQELLKTAMLDRQTTLISDGKADVLAQLLLNEGPERLPRGPHEVTFVDPDEPEGELEVA